MAEAALPTLATLRHSPLETYAQRFASAGRDDTVRLVERPFLAMVDVRIGVSEPVDATVFDRVEQALGIRLPTTPGASGGTTTSVLWLGPDWWLVVGPDGTADEVAVDLRTAAGSAHVSIVDVSGWRTTLELSGRNARDVLSTGCSIDLHPRAFPAGSCAQTLLARAPVILQRPVGRPSFRIYVRSSYAGHVAEWLLDAMAEFV